MRKPATVGPNPDSQRLLQSAVARSARTAGVQLPVGFVRRDPYGTAKPPLARMLQGGRGGEVRLKLYLSQMLVATAAPYGISPSVPARAWAEMVGLPDPAGNGARRISDAVGWLSDNNFIRVQRQPGTPPHVVLKSPLGDGKKYERPRSPYVTLPVSFWWSQWITALSGAGTALLIVLLDLQGGQDDPDHARSLPGEKRARYGLSDDTWTRASAELSRHGILKVKRVIEGSDLGWRRRRNTYWVDKQRMKDEPDPAILRALYG